MKIVFMGTPEFAIPSLEKLLTGKHRVELVVTAPDKERGRGKQITGTPIKEFSLQQGLKVVTPISLKDEIFISQLKEVDADLFVIVAFRILPREVFTIPKKGSFNLHGSLLPKYRGAAPIQWSLINGDNETGVTTFFLDEKVDTGKIILKEILPILDQDNFGTLHDKMMMLGAEAVSKTVELIDSGLYELQMQDNSLASPAPKITKEICRIDWNKPAVEIHNLVRGLSPSPCAFFEQNGKNYKIYKTEIMENGEWRIENEINSQLEGKVIQTKNDIMVQTGNGVLKILELQQEGRKRMNTEEFLRGSSLL
jgi:methionyl-tRNA formyltransferase